MNLPERSPQTARRGRPTSKRLGRAAAVGLSLTLATACGAESDPPPPTSGEATSAVASEQPTSSIVTSPDTPTSTPARRTVTAQVAKSWCDSAGIVKLVAPLFSSSESLICHPEEGSIGFSSATVGGDLNTSVTVGEASASLETIGATYPGYACGQSQCSRKDTGDVGVYLKAPDGLIVGATYHNLADKPGSEQRQYGAVAALARTAMEMVPAN